eukprot:TRINITY_DN5136_c0_g1_i1.p1 TRINITY_DN5136_c0_g1~~TRINITY_DN5136_c0_g1_i1.p1  ORF type:complete len:807 (+),score=331.49 TRINITY_DN5136_c0_g1_i1:49-2421(+)
MAYGAPGLCLTEEKSRDVWSVLRALLLHYARVAVDADSADAPEVARRALIDFFAGKTERDKEVGRWEADERAYKYAGFSEALLAEGCGLQYGIRDRFFVVGYEADGAVLVRVSTAKKQVQVFKVKALHGRCLRAAFAGQTFVALRTTLLPWEGGIVCLGCETARDFEAPGGGADYGDDGDDICGSEFGSDQPAAEAAAHVDPSAGLGLSLPPIGDGALLFDIPMPAMEIGGGLPNLVPPLPVPEDLLTPGGVGKARPRAEDVVADAAPQAEAGAAAAPGTHTSTEGRAAAPPQPTDKATAATPENSTTQTAAPPPDAAPAAGAPPPGAAEDAFSLRVKLDVKVELGKAYLAACDNGTVLKTLLPVGKREGYAAAAKTRGNECFKRKDFAAALEWYRAGLRAAPAVDLCSNAALMALKLQDGAAALGFCTAGLRLAPGHLKCSFRKVQAQVLIGLPGEANALFTSLPREEQVGDAGKEVRRSIDALAAARAPAGADAAPWWARRQVAEAVAQYLAVEDLEEVAAASKRLAGAFADGITTVSVARRHVRAALLPLAHLTHLSLENCTGVNDVAVSVVLSRCRALTSLALRGCVGVTKRAVDELLRHVRLQQPRTGLLPGMPQESQAALGDLPALPGMTAAAPADGAAAPPARKARRARHREALFNTPIEAEAKVALTAVDLAYCDQIAPSAQLTALGLAVDLTTTCRPCDFYFSPAPSVEAPYFLIAPRAEHDAGGALDVDGRFLFHNQPETFAACPVGPFALASTLPLEEAHERLAALGVVCRRDLSMLAH